MHDVLIVEDEPAAQRYVARVVDDHCPGFRVVAMVENGRDALTYLEEATVDLVITDVRMPVVDGVELINLLREAGNHVPVLVLSGHDDFEYVRGALTAGAVDYVLKPAGANRMKTVLADISARIDHRRDRVLADIVASAVGGVSPAPDQLMLVPEFCFLAMMRIGGLPPRQQPVGLSGDAVPVRIDGVTSVPGRDTRDAVFVGIAGRDSSLDTGRFRRIVVECDPATIPFLAVTAAGTITRAIELHPVPRNQWMTAIPRLVARLDEAIRPGRGSLTEGSGKPPVRQLDDALRRKLEFAADAGHAALIARALGDLAQRWEDRAVPLTAVRRDADQCAAIVTGGAAVDQIDSLLEDPLDYRTIAAGLVDRLAPIDPEREVPLTFRSIRAWVDEHFREALSVQQVADEFHLSPSYVGKLFRKFQGQPMGEYVNELRVALARELLIGDDALSVKEIAATCGFSDQFYFSRVFKESEGSSPSEFRKNRGKTS